LFYLRGDMRIELANESCNAVQPGQYRKLDTALVLKPAPSEVHQFLGTDRVNKGIGHAKPEGVSASRPNAHLTHSINDEVV
jgi:hypothetical protein